MVTNNLINLRFKHFVDIIRCDCLFGSARDNRTGKLQNFLIYNHAGPIYLRNGLNDTWELVEGHYDSNHIRDLVSEAVACRVPTYTSDASSVLN